MRSPRSHLTRRPRSPAAVLLLVVAVGLGAGCDSDGGDTVSAGEASVADDAIDPPASPNSTSPAVSAVTTEPSPDPATPDTSATTDEVESSATWPDESTTGVRDASLLTPSGSVSISTDGAVVENLDVTGSISIDADNVTVRNVRVTADGAKYLISIGLDRRGIVIEDVELDGRRIATHGVVHGGYTARRVNLHGVGDGFRAGSSTVIEDSWVHDLGHDGAHDSSPHFDAVQSVGGDDIVIRNNRLEGPLRAQTSAIIMKADFAPITNVVIENNLVSGGTYTMYLVSDDKYPAMGADVQVRNNVWVTDSWKFGHMSRSGADEVQLDGNTFDDGTPI